MSTRLALPSDVAVSSLLRDLLGRGVSVTEAIAGPIHDAVSFAVAYVDDDDLPVVFAAGDLAFSMLGGAALAMIPAGRAQDAISAERSDEDLAEIYWEIMNVVSRLLNDDNAGVHVRWIPGSRVDPESVSSDMAGTAFAVDIDGYGVGTLSFWEPTAS